MNANMHGVKLMSPNERGASTYDGETVGWVDLVEGGIRNGGVSLYFHSADDCEEIAQKLSEIAERMRELEGES